MMRTNTTTNLRHAPGISLASSFKLDDDQTKVPKYKWLHVASEGEFAGHADGAFKLDREVFTEFIKNFRADPRFKSGKGVIPFDFEHASEMAPTSGSIPQKGAVAAGWVIDLAVREGPGGEVQLWAYAKLGDEIRGYIANDEYRHVSIAFSLDGSDPMTGRSIGPLLTSIAFTNHPFLRGLTPIAAKRKDKTIMRINQLRTLADIRALRDAGELRSERDMALCIELVRKERGPLDWNALHSEAMTLHSRLAKGESNSLEDAKLDPRDLTDVPIDLDADDAVEQVADYLADLDSDLGALPREELQAYARACIDFTREKQAESVSAEPRASASDPATLLRQAGFSSSELLIIEQSRNPTVASVAINDARDPEGFGKLARERKHFNNPKVRELANKIRGALMLADTSRGSNVRTLSAPDGYDRLRPPVSPQPGQAPLPTLAELRTYPPARGVQSDLAHTITWMNTKMNGAFVRNSWEVQCREARTVLGNILAREQQRAAAGGS
jgi:hypothetical protein